MASVVPGGEIVDAHQGRAILLAGTDSSGVKVSDQQRPLVFAIKQRDRADFVVSPDEQ